MNKSISLEQYSLLILLLRFYNYGRPGLALICNRSIRNMITASSK